IPTIPQTVTARGAPNAPYCYSKHSSGSPGSAGRTAMWWGISAVVDELQVDVQIAALEQGDDGLQIVAALGLHAQLVALDLALDALGALVADDLADLLRVLAGDAVLERGDDAVLLAAGEGLAGFQALQGDAALDELGLEHVEHGLGALLGVRLDEDLLAAPGDGRVGALEVVALLDLLAGLVQCVFGLLVVNLGDDVERGVS